MASTGGFGAFGAASTGGAFGAPTGGSFGGFGGGFGAAATGGAFGASTGGAFGAPAATGGFGTFGGASTGGAFGASTGGAFGGGAFGQPAAAAGGMMGMQAQQQANAGQAKHWLSANGQPVVWRTQYKDLPDLLKRKMNQHQVTAPDMCARLVQSKTCSSAT